MPTLESVARAAARATAAACLALSVAATSAAAQVITYTFAGTGSGTLAQTTFEAIPFTAVLTGDAMNATVVAPGIVSNGDLSATITLGGLGTATFSELLRVFVNQNNLGIGFASPTKFDLIDVLDVAGAATYDLRTSFGPVFDADPFFAQFTNVATSLGPLTFTDVRDVTFTAVVQATPIPEPGTWALLATGLVGVAGMARRTRRRA